MTEPRDSASSKLPSKPRWLVPVLAAAAAVVVITTPWWGPAILRHLDFFRVRRVEVTGVRYVQAQDILERLKIDTLHSVWDPTGPWEKRAEEHPLVREASIDRKLPGTLVVRLIEHVPVALVPARGGFRAYDVRGVALPIDVTASDVNAPIVASADTVILGLLAQARSDAPVLYSRISEVRRERARDTSGDSLRSMPAPGGDELVFVLDSFPVRARADITLQRFTDVELVEQDLARRRLRALELDLRYRDQVIARLP